MYTGTNGCGAWPQFAWTAISKEYIHDCTSYPIYTCTSSNVGEVYRTAPGEVLYLHTMYMYVQLYISLS